MKKISKMSAIVAMTKEGIIGNEGNMPWYYPEDLKYFKEATIAHPIVMGRKTYESICEKFPDEKIRAGGPLVGRRHIILTNQENYDTGAEWGTKVVNSYEEAKWILNRYVDTKPVKYYSDKEYNWKRPFIIGGGEIYNMFWDDLDELYLTLIHESHKGDTFFPRKINLSEWKIKESDNTKTLSFYKLSRIR